LRALQGELEIADRIDEGALPGMRADVLDT